MKKITKVAAYMVGATMIAGASAYMAMPKEAREDLKSLASNLLKRKQSKPKCRPRKRIPWNNNCRCN